MLLIVSTTLDHGCCVHRAHEVSLNVNTIRHIQQEFANGFGPSMIFGTMCERDASGGQGGFSGKDHVQPSTSSDIIDVHVRVYIYHIGMSSALFLRF